MNWLIKSLSVKNPLEEGVRRGKFILEEQNGLNKKYVIFLQDGRWMEKQWDSTFVYKFAASSNRSPLQVFKYENGFCFVEGRKFKVILD